MKLIEALKQTKDLARKADDLRGKIATFCADMTHEAPVYGTEEQQRQQVASWLQAHSDVLKEILRLRVAIQRTNLETKVAIDIGSKTVTKTIAEWIHRRKDLAGYEAEAWGRLGDKNLPSSAKIKSTSGSDLETKIRRYYDPKQRDEMRELFISEKALIDGRLEIVNAVTDLIE